MDYDIKETEINGVKVLTQQLHVGWSYSIPSLFEGKRRSNNEQHALDQAKEDIETEGEAHEWRHSEANSGSPEHVFTLKQKIAALEAKVGTQPA